MKENDCDLKALERLLESAPCGVGLFDTVSGKAIYLNREYYRMVGYTKQEYRKLRSDQIFRPDQYVRQESAEEFKNSGKALQYEYRIIQKSGAVRWFRINAVTICADGEKTAFVSFVDVTEEKNALRQLKLITENIGGSLSLFHISEKGEQLIYANSEFFKTCGMSEDVFRAQVKDFYSTLLSPQDNALMHEEAHKSMEDGKPRELVQRMTLPDGRRLWVRRRIAALKQEEKNCYLMVAVATDITEKREAEIRAELEQRRFRTVIKELNAAVIEWDRQNNQFYFSDAFSHYAVSDVTAEDLLKNRGPIEFVHPDDRGRLLRFFEEASSGRERAETTLRTKMKDGSFRWCRMLGFFYKDEEGCPSRTIGVFIDINEEHERQFMLNNLLNELPGGVAIFRLTDRLECQYFSDGFAALSGRTRAEVEEILEDDAKLEQCISKENYAEFVKDLRTQTEIGKPSSFTYHFFRKDGKIDWLHVSANKIREEKGCPVFYCIYTVPTDERAQYQSIVEDSAIGVFVAERKNKRIFYTNEAFRTICGIDEANIIGTVVPQILAKYQKKELLTAQEVASLSFDHYHEFHVERHGIYMGIKAKAIVWNNVDAYILYITDETEVMSAHAEMERNYIKEQTLMDSIPGGTAIYRAKKNGAVVVEYASEGYCKMVGYTREEILSCSDIGIHVYPEDACKTAAKVEGFIKMGKPISLYYRIVTKTGEVVLNRLDAKVMSTEELGPDDFAVLYAVHTRITDEAKLMMQEQEYYRMALSLTGSAYCEWDAERGFYASKEYKNYLLSNEGFEALMGHGKDTDAVHPEDMPLVKHYMGVIENNKSGRSITVRLKMKDGHYQWTEVVAVAGKDAEGNFTKLVGVFRDVDKEWIERNRKLQKALAAAERANRAKTAFLSRVSHDMRTPLNGILGLTSFLKESVTDEKTAKDVAQLEISGQYLLNLINDTLDISRIENGKLELHPVVCDGKETFDNIIKLVKPSVDAKQLQFIVNTMNIHFTKLFVDVSRVEQIVMNIIGNAVKFTPEGGTVSCTLEQIDEDDTSVTSAITIRDTGIGMSKEFLPVLFDAFSQADNNLVNSRQGTGLGMAITKQLVDLMQGTIEVESELGKGSSFRIVIPFRKATDEQISAWRKSICPETDDSILMGKRVLLCEDHPLNREIATRLLQNKGVKVESAENGKIGLAMFEASAKNYYDAIFMDIRMPELDGLDATRAIRKLAREDAHTIPIIAMTGNSFDEDIAMTQAAGMNAHLSKPVNSVKLFETLREQLSKTTFFRRKKILVVDDVETTRAIIRATIAPDYDLLEADDGEEALKLLEGDNQIDLVITDLMMRRMDGYELIRQIRSKPKMESLPIIANTQYDEISKEQELLDLGANAVMYKPNAPQEIKDKIHKAIA